MICDLDANPVAAPRIPNTEIVMTEVHDLLAADALAHDAQYREGLSNHLPMALIALAGLGASRERIAEFRERYARRLEPAPSAPEGAAKLQRADLAGHLGTHACYAQYAELFRALVREREPREVGRDVLRELLPGLAGGAFHGLIRVAYALGTPGAPPEEIAAALAYMADVHLVLEPASPDVVLHGATRSVVSIMKEVATDPAARGYVGKRGLIFDDLADVASRHSFAPFLLTASHGARTLDEAAHAALLLYASTAHFTALHCVTATHALRVLAPLLTDTAMATAVLARALVVAYVTMSAPPLMADDGCDRMRARIVPPWEEIARAACASDNEHVVKIVWTAREEHAAHGDPLYRFVAARAAGLVSDGG